MTRYSIGIPVAQRPSAEFRGTITYASLNAHLKVDLSRRDDLWSFYFVIMDFLNLDIPWSNSSSKDEVKDIKLKCFANPEKYFWANSAASNYPQLKEVFIYLNSLKYED